MNYKQLKSNLKAELKELAISIRSLKNKRGPSNNGYVSGLMNEQFQFRVKHIAYCMLRGRAFEEIERKHRDPEDGKFAKKVALEILEKYKEKLDETVCPSA